MPALKAPAYFQSVSPRREQPSSDLTKLDFVKAIFFQGEPNPFKHRQLLFQIL
jgi:hypothetical protein